MEKTISIILICLLSFLAIFLTTFLIFGLVKGDDFTMFGGKTKEVKNETYKIEEIKNLEFDFKSSDILVKIEDTEELRVVQYSNKNIKEKDLFTSNINGDTLRISDKQKGISFCIGFCFTSVDYEITIPSKYSNNIEINNQTGDIEFTGDTALNTLNIKGTTGDIELKSDIKAKEVMVSRTSGDMSINKIKADNVDIHFTTGDLVVQTIESFKTKIKGTTGDINLKDLTGVLDLNLTTGDININNFKITGSSNMKATTSDINVILDQSANCNVILDSRVGDKNFPNNSSLVGSGKYELKIKTTTGDINVK